MDKKNEDIFVKFQAFSFGRLTDAANVISQLTRYRIDPADFVAAVRDKQEFQREAKLAEVAERGKTERRAEKERRSWNSRAPKCPDCNTPLSLRPIRVKQCNRNRFGYKSHWICPHCVWEQYSVNPIEEEVKPYLREA